MKLLVPILAIATPLAATAADNPNPYESIRQEIRQSIARGNAWLKAQQNAEGYWSDPQLPAFTALALKAALRDPNLDRKAPLPDHLEKSLSWLLAQQKEDGGIYNRGLSVYNTATAVTALLAADRREYDPAIVKARKHLINNQWDIDKKGETDNPNDGGVGYGSDPSHTDLSNTYLAIEAIALSRKVV
nr:hypothetical protein [Akkermansiaceae bacterium]